MWFTWQHFIKPFFKKLMSLDFRADKWAAGAPV
jgi:hypothetical protein